MQEESQDGFSGGQVCAGFIGKFPHFHKKVCQPNASIVYFQGGGNMVQSRMMNVTDLCSISTTAALHLPEKVKLLQCNGRHL